MSRTYETLMALTDAPTLRTAAAIGGAAFAGLVGLARYNHRLHNRNQQTGGLDSTEVSPAADTASSAIPVNPPSAPLPAPLYKGPVYIGNHMEARPVRAVATVPPSATNVRGSYPVASVSTVVGHIL